MSERIAGSSVLVTGGGSGIGEAIARSFVASGARVTVSGRRAARAEAVAASLGEACAAQAGDVSVAADRETMLATALAHGGGLTTLIHAAADMYRGPLPELVEDELLNLFHGNVVGPMMLTGAALPELRRGRGNVILFGSVHTQRAFPGVSPYAATKGAIEALTAVLAAELGPQGVRVNAIRPGGVPTEINVRAGLGTPEENLARLESLAAAHALGRYGSPEEVAEGAVYLAGADWVTGTVLTVDGGLSLGVTQA
ncbi:MAG TPA: SDR family oxidoreductase [Solirubrobacteraceae bacterium]|nr:SDR family oxidoreductase [Solirubrobacteraceae bacterium]